MVDNLVKSEVTKGVVIGVAVALLCPLILPAVIGGARPFARAAIKSGIIFYEKTRETLAEVGEVLDDLMAEAQADLRQQHATASDTTAKNEQPAAEE